MSEEEKKKPEYDTTYKTQRDSYLNEIINRPAFSYDVNADALYQQYKDVATRNGQQAMKDTIGKAAAITGGYGNSYAVTAGQQAYNSYMDGLNDVIPELYQLALNKYTQEGTELQNKYSLLGGLDEQEYSRYQNDLNTYYADNGIVFDNNGKPKAVSDDDVKYEKPTIDAIATAIVLYNSVDESKKAEVLAEYLVQHPEYDADTFAALVTQETGWSMTADGGWNSLFGLWEDNEAWGIDRNGKVLDTYGNSYSMVDLYDALVDAGMDKANAKTYVIDFQKKMGI